MELTTQKKLAEHIFRLLKVTEITFPIGRTNKGNLGIKFNVNTEDFEIMLDSVPLSTKDVLQDDNNIELKHMLLKYLFDAKPREVIKEIPIVAPMEHKGKFVDEMIERVVIPAEKIEKKKRGRPAGSKNK